MPRAGSLDTTHLDIYTSSHDNDGPRQTRPILLIFSLRSCLHLRATPFSAEGVGADASSSYLSDTNPNTDLHSGYSTSMRMFHIMRAPLFSSSSDVPLVFSAFALFFLPNLLPPSHVAAASRSKLVDVGTRRVGHAPVIYWFICFRGF
jgi:hypothetical protein